MSTNMEVGYETDGDGCDGTQSLWAAALNRLSDTDKKDLELARGNQQLKPSQVFEAVETKKEECIQKQWILYTNKAGEKVPVRKVLGKVVDWLDRFKNVVDTAVQFDPGHAAIPWAVVRTLLQMGVNNCQAFGNMLEGIEAISSIIARYTELETKVLIRKSSLSNQLAGVLVKLYEVALLFLVHAYRYYGQSSFKRAMKATVTTSKILVEEPMLRIEKHEEEVYKLVRLVQNEITDYKLNDISDEIRVYMEGIGVTNRERLRNLTAWINCTDTKNTYETALQYHHHGTCQWVLQLPEFLRWNSVESLGPRLFWLHGPAGFGKTFMAAQIIQNLEEQKQGSLAYFFCVADEQRTRDPYAVLRSWLTQLAGQNDNIALAMDDIRKARNMEQTLTQLGLWDLFIAADSAFNECTFVLDGFDECNDIDTGVRYHRDDPRGNFLRDLVKHLSKTNYRVLIISRDVPDIREHLAGNLSDELSRFEYGITAKDTSKDVLSFSEHVVNTKLSKKPASLRLEIAALAAEHSDGMFLRVKLLENEISPGQNAKQLKKTVKEMPSGISEAYSRELERMAGMPPEKKAAAVTILRWVLFAVRPLQVKQLAEALVISGDKLEEYPADELPDCWGETFVDDDFVKDNILSRCGSLLQLRSNVPGTPLADQTVHFVHFSVNEYLMNVSGSLGTEWLGLEGPGAEERRLSELCLRYLTLNTFEQIPEDTGVYPFLSYAAWAWYYHGYHEKPAPGKEILRWTQRAFDPAILSWKVWTPLMEKEVNRKRSMGHKTLRPHRIRAKEHALTPIYHASLLGLTDVIRWLGDQGLDCGCVGGRFGFPLQAAVVGNHEDVVKYLINRGVDVSQTGGWYGAALVAAAAESTTDIVRILLKAGAKVSATDDKSLSPLHYAAYRGNVDVVQMLLDHGADIGEGSAEASTPVYYACAYGHLDVVKLLAARGADLKAVDKKTGFTPLHVAIRRESEDVIAFLVDYGISLNELAFTGQGPIHVAIRNPDLVRILVSMGADVDLPNGRGFTPMQYAAVNGWIASISALLDAGADINSTNCPNKATPLQAAVVSKQRPTAKYLLEMGADIEGKTRGTVTALMLAMSQKQEDAVMWLLDEGALLAGVDENKQQSLFDMAVDSPETAQLLVRYGCFGAGRKDGAARLLANDDALVMRAYNGDAKGVATCLAEKGGGTTKEALAEALQAAAARGYLETVEVLLGQRAPVNLRDINGRTALHHAVRHMHLSVADALVDSGASVSIEDAIGSTPIDLAVASGATSAQFIRDRMDWFTMDISHRPSLLEVGPADVHAIERTRNAMEGTWEGHYGYIAWRQGVEEPFSVSLAAGERPGTFSSEGKDVVGEFKVCGFVDSIGTAWFAKLYQTHGWLYRGAVRDGEVFRGTWGRNRKLSCGTFELRRARVNAGTARGEDV